MGTGLLRNVLKCLKQMVKVKEAKRDLAAAIELVLEDRREDALLGIN